MTAFMRAGQAQARAGDDDRTLGYGVAVVDGRLRRRRHGGVAHQLLQRLHQGLA